MNWKLHINNCVHFKLSSKHSKIFKTEYENVQTIYSKHLNVQVLTSHQKSLSPEFGNLTL